MNAVSRYGREQLAELPPATVPPRNPTRALSRVGRYVLHPAIARGGMATVHAARLVAAEGVTRLVAAKRLHPHFIDDPEFVAMFHDEARIASRIHHPNVVPVLDVVRSNDEVILVQEYVHGVPLSHLFKLGLGREPMPIAIAAATISGVLAGLHAAHEATDETGEPLSVVHRDVSPQNILISVDGVPRLVDFGIAKATTSTHHTREGFFKGKLAYMSPEQIRAEPVSRQTDIYAAGVLLWELVANRKFYEGKNDADFVRAVASGTTPSLLETLEPERDRISDERWAAILKLESVINRAMAKTECARYRTADVMASELVAAVGMASPKEVAAWVRRVGAEWLDDRQRVLSANEENYRASIASQRAAMLVRGPSSQSRFVDSVSSSSVELDDSGRSSGPRIRSFDEVVGAAGAATAGETARLVTVGSMIQPASTRRSWASLVDVFTIDSRVKALLPWIVVGGLLLLVGVLTGMMLVRDPRAGVLGVGGQGIGGGGLGGGGLGGGGLAEPGGGGQPSVPSAPATVPPSGTSFELPDEGAAAPAPALERKSPSPSAPAAGSPPGATSPPPATRWRGSSPAYSRSTSQSSGTSAAARHDCTPPFYFDGNKKIFKPNCL